MNTISPMPNQFIACEVHTVVEIAKSLPSTYSVRANFFTVSYSLSFTMFPDCAEAMRPFSSMIARGVDASESGEVAGRCGVEVKLTVRGRDPFPAAPISWGKRGDIDTNRGENQAHGVRIMAPAHVPVHFWGILWIFPESGIVSLHPEVGVGIWTGTRFYGGCMSENGSPTIKISLIDPLYHGSRRSSITAQVIHSTGWTISMSPSSHIVSPSLSPG